MEKGPLLIQEAHRDKQAKYWEVRILRGKVMFARRHTLKTGEINFAMKKGHEPGGGRRHCQQTKIEKSVLEVCQVIKKKKRILMGEGGV